MSNSKKQSEKQSKNSNKKIIPCLDLRHGKVVVGQKFKDVKDVSDDPFIFAKRYSEQGADELVIYDITASREGRQVFGELLKGIAAEIAIPLTVGGGVSTVADIQRLFGYGADKISMNTGAIRNPKLLAEASREFAREALVFAIDVRKVDGTYRVFTAGGQTPTDLNAIDWAKKAEQDGAGELVLNCIATDGLKTGFALDILADFSKAVSLPIIASGGAGRMEDFATLFTTLPTIAGGLAASVFHFNEISIPDLKKYLAAQGIPVAL